MPDDAKTTLADKDLHLFIDDSCLLSVSGIARRVNQICTNSEPVVRPDNPWEGSYLGYGVVRRSGDKYLMWYDARPPAGEYNDSYICVAYSEDGIRWEKPRLNLVNHRTISDTNIVLSGGDGTIETLQPFSLGDAEAGYSGLIYKAWRDEARKKTFWGMCHAWSADGNVWELNPEPVLAFEGDRMCVNWDAHHSRFLLTTRHSGFGDHWIAPLRGLRRDVDVWSSDDLLRWTHEGRALQPDSLDKPSLEIYGMSIVAYGSGYLGFVEAYDSESGLIDVQLASSQDGVRWNRCPDRSPVLSVGGIGAWDSRWVMVLAGDPVATEESLTFWYTGASTHHGSKLKTRRAIGIGTIRRDGFVSLESGSTGGEFVSESLPANEPRVLEVNADFEAGSLQAEILDYRGCPIEGFTRDRCRWSGDNGVRLRASWGGVEVVPRVPDGQIHVRFIMKLASMYSFRWSSME